MPLFNPSGGGNTGSISGGTTRATLGEVVFSNANGLSFGVAGQTVTAQHNALTSQSNQAFSAGGGSSAFQTLSFSNANGISFSNNAGQVQASYTVPVQSNQQITFFATGNTTQSSTGTSNASSIIFRGEGLVSIGITGGSVLVSATQTNPVVSNALQSVGSATGSGTNTSRFAADDHVHAGVFSIGVSTAGNTSGDTRVDVGRFVFQGGNNITLSQLTAANALNTIIFSGAAAGGAQTAISGIEVSNTTYTSGTVTFRNANGISFGSSGAQGISASYTVPTVPAQISAGFSTGGNTLGDTGLVTGRLVLIGGNNVTLSGSTNAGSISVTISGPNTAAQSNQQMTMFATGNTTLSSTGTSNASSLIFRGSNLVSVGITNGSVLIDATQTNPVVSNALQSVGSATGSGTNTSRFAADDHVHAGVFSIGVSTGGNTAGNTRVDVGRFVFVGGNNITLSQGTAAGALNTITISAGAGGGDTRLTAYATGNTTQSSTGTIPFSSYIYRGEGIASVGVSNGSIVVSVPAGAPSPVNFSAGTTSNNLGSVVFSNSNQLSFGLNGSTITGSFGDPPLAIWRPDMRNVDSAATAVANSLVSIMPFIIGERLAASQIRVAASVSVATAANTSSAYLDVSMSGVWYTRNGSTLSSIFSHSGTFTQFAQSNSTGTISGVNAFTMTFPATTLAPNEYFLALHVSTTNSATGGANTTALGRTLSMMKAGLHASAVHLYKPWGSSTNATLALIGGQGMISTGATRATIAFTDYTMTGTRMENAGPLYIELRNVSWQP